jgi:hypothetical protein
MNIGTHVEISDMADQNMEIIPIENKRMHYLPELEMNAEGLD